MPEPKRLAEAWDEGLAVQDPFLRRMRDGADVTLPYLAPDRHRGGHGDDLPRPHQTVGARGVNNLASRLTLGTFPTQFAPARYELNVYEYARQGGDPAKLSDANLALARRMREVQRHLDVSAARAVFFEAFQHLLVGGNYLVQMLPDGSFRGYRMDNFQVRRDAYGRVAKVLVKEFLSREELPEGFGDVPSDVDETRPGDRDEVAVYTCVERYQTSPTKHYWEAYQEIAGRTLEPERYTRDADLPWLVLRMFPDSNEDYGRAFVELHLGSLMDLEAFSQAMADMAAISSRTVCLAQPGSLVTPKRLSEAENGEVLAGNADLVGFLSVDKLGDFQVVQSQYAILQRDLEMAFLMKAGVQRQAERQTAFEWQVLTQELDETLGGAFSLQGPELQVPLIEKIEAFLVRTGRIPRLPEGLAEVRINTGLAALGRGREEFALREFLQEAQIVFREQAALFVDGSEYMKRLAVTKGIDPNGLVRTPEQVQAVVAQQNRQEILTAAAPSIVSARQEASANQQE